MTVSKLLARQGGVITRKQALAEGFTESAVDHRVRSRIWLPLHPQVYLAAGHAQGPEVAARAAVLWGGEGAVLDGPAAAWWHGLLTQPPPVFGLSRAPGRKPHDRPTVSVRARMLDPLDVVALRGVAVTAAPLTVLDTAVVLGAEVLGAEFLDGALRHGIDGEELQGAHTRMGGAAGAATAGRLLTGAAERVAAPARDRLLRQLQAAGREGWIVAPPVPGAAEAVVHPRDRLAVFVDGWAGRPHAAVRWPGWTVLRCTAPDVHTRPRSVLATIDRAHPLDIRARRAVRG